MKSGNLNFLEPSGPLQARNGTALPYIISENVPLSVLIVLKSGNLDLLQPSGPLQICTGIALPLPMYN